MTLEIRLNNISAFINSYLHSRKIHLSITIRLLILFSAIFAVYCENHTESLNKMLKNIHILKVTAGGTKQILLYSIHCALKSEEDTEKEVYQRVKALFCVWLTAHLGLVLVNNQLDAQFLFVCIYSNSLHVSSTPVLIIRRINCINAMSGICRSPSSVQVWMERQFHPNLHTRRSPT